MITLAEANELRFGVGSPSFNARLYFKTLMPVRMQKFASLKAIVVNGGRIEKIFAMGRAYNGLSNFYRDGIVAVQNRISRYDQVTRCVPPAYDRYGVNCINADTLLKHLGCYKRGFYL